MEDILKTMAGTNLYTADAHDAQMRILRELLMGEGKSFAELTKSSKLTSDHANYHIKQLMGAGLVEHIKKEYGRYSLTRVGKEYANNMDTDNLVIEKQPKLTVDLAVERGDGKFVFQERRKQPYYGYWGFPTGKIRWGESMTEAGARELMEETGLIADMRVVGFFHKLDYDADGTILEDKYLCLIHCTNPKGELITETESHANYWLTPDEYNAKANRFGIIEETIGYLRDDKPFVSEKTYTYSSDSY